MRDYDLVIAGVASGGDEGAAVARTGQPRRARNVLLLVQPWHVITGKFFEGVQRNQIVDIHGNALRLESLDDPRKFLLVFRIDSWPQHFTCRFSEKLPIALGDMRVFQFDRLESIRDLACQQVAVLKANALGRALEVDICPAALAESGKPSATADLPKTTGPRYAIAARPPSDRVPT